MYKVHICYIVQLHTQFIWEAAKKFLLLMAGSLRPNPAIIFFAASLCGLKTSRKKENENSTWGHPVQLYLHNNYRYTARQISYSESVNIIKGMATF